MKNNLLDTLILTIIFFGVLILGDISYKEFLYGGTCSKFSIVPACYVALFYFLILFVLQIFKKLEIWFIILAGFALTFTAFASVGHIFGRIDCPISEIGIPSCFIGFTMFFILLVLKFIQVRVERRT